MNKKPPLVLSKSKYLEGLQCPKLLWYEYYRKQDFPGIDAATRAIFDEGRRVGECAQRLFPGGLKIERDFDPHKQTQKSLAALKLRRPLFEAGFVYGRAFALADILVPAGDDAWDLIEVKSSTQIKDEHCEDAAFQKYTYEGAGLKLRQCFIMYINSDYVRQGALEPARLFHREDISEAAAERQKEIGQKLAALLKIIDSPQRPEVGVGPHCGRPHDCPLEELCWNFLPELDNVFILYRGGRLRYDLLERGILNLAEIPPEELNDKQLLQVKSHGRGEPYINPPALREFFDKISYPLYFLDFETIAPAIPVYDQTRPYQEVLFQYSLDVVAAEGAEPVHYEYLAPGDADPRPEVLRQLKERLGESGALIAYYAPFEMKVIKHAAEVYRDYLPWAEKLPKRFVDLLEPFKNLDYYHPDQAGSASLKKVLPAVTGRSYQGLAIGSGQLAAAEYYRVTFNQVEEKDRQAVRAALLKYCGLDTRGMIDVLAALKLALETA